MNRVFSTVWNKSLGCWVVASEHASQRGKRGRSARRLASLTALALLSPVSAWAADQIGRAHV